MEIIRKIADNFAIYNIRDNMDFNEVIQNVRSKLNDIDDHLHKIRFIKIILENNNAKYDLHKPHCTAPDRCEKNLAYESVAYYLMQELNRLGIKIDGDTFNQDEKSTADAKLDQILKDLGEVKAGNQIIYEDLLKEINDLKELYFLGKKRWYEIFVGKSIEMGISGIVSETVSKKIIEDFKPIYKALLEN